jgi:hypothetical protein
MLHYALRGSGYIDVALTPSHDAFWSHSHRLALCSSTYMYTNTFNTVSLSIGCYSQPEAKRTAQPML